MCPDWDEQIRPTPTGWPTTNKAHFLAMGGEGTRHEKGIDEKGSAKEPPGTAISHALLVSHAMHIAFAKLVDGLGKAPITDGFDINKTRPMEFYAVDLSDVVALLHAAAIIHGSRHRRRPFMGLTVRR